MMATILRWILVLPGAILTLVVVYAMNVITTSTVIGPAEPGSITDTVNRMFFSLLSGGAFVYAGIWISPTRAPVVGFALAAVAVLTMGMAIVVALETRDWSALLQVLSTAVGAGVTAYIYAQDPHLQKRRASDSAENESEAV